MSGEDVEARAPMRAQEVARASRLLIQAVDATTHLDGIPKVFALAAITRAAVTAAPEQAAWLASEAETDARSIDSSDQRTSALAQVARALIAVNLERAETIALSIENAALRSDVLVKVAKATAVVDVDHAVAIARSIGLADDRSRALGTSLMW